MPRSLREQIARGHEYGDMFRADQAEVQRMKENRRMPKRTPQDDLNRDAIDVKGIGADLDSLHQAAVEALDAATAAGQREAAIESASSDRLSGRFPGAGR